MKPFLWTCALLALALTLNACTGSSPVEPSRTPVSPSAAIEVARETLVSYFRDLHTGDYAAAAGRYGGELGALVAWNPDVDPSDPAALLEAVCTRQLQCLPVRSIASANQVDETSFEFKIEFSNPDGSLFVLGPCCGATKTEMPPISQFDCTVKKRGVQDYEVMCLPVFVP